jgi:hypothetical protein
VQIAELCLWNTSNVSTGSGGSFMVWYVAIVAVVNLALGYLAGRYMGIGQRPTAYAIDDGLESDDL